MLGKVYEVVRSLTSDYVALIPDDDITFPHAIDSALAYLEDYPDYAVCHGYQLNFDLHGHDLDIHTVFGFTPTVGEDHPLDRHYHLMRRYQPFVWGVLRTHILLSAITEALLMAYPLFEELMFMNVTVLQGKAARLPMVYALRSTARSSILASRRHPLFWFLHDAQSFFENYSAYRNALAQFVRGRETNMRTSTPLEQLLDLIHATWLGREIDLGVLNHAARLLLGDSIPPIPEPTFSIGWRDIEHGDLIHQSDTAEFRYIWRKTTVAEREEVRISAEEMARVERQLDLYPLSSLVTECS